MNLVKIGTVVKISKGKKANLISKNELEFSYRFIQIDDLRNNTNLKFTDSKGVHVVPEDVIIAWDGANAGTIGYGLSGIIGSTLAKLELQTDGILPVYLGRFLKSKSQYLRSKSTGATIPHISGKVLTNLQVPVPSVDEQKRIVYFLDEADKLSQKRKHSINLLDEYIDSIFIETFGNPVINSMNWNIKYLGEIADICSGVTKGRKFNNLKTVNVPYMRVANVQDGHIDLTEIKEIEVLPSDIEKYRLLNGDILLTEGGDPDKLGRGGIWRGLVDDCIHQNHIFRVRLNLEESIPEYISAQIGSDRGKKYFLKSAKQTTGIATINITQLKNFPVLLPPINLQIKFAKIVNDTIFLKQKMLLQAQELDIQFQALTQKSFQTA